MLDVWIGLIIVSLSPIMKRHWILVVETAVLIINISAKKENNVVLEESMRNTVTTLDSESLEKDASHYKTNFRKNASKQEREQYHYPDLQVKRPETNYTEECSTSIDLDNPPFHRSFPERDIAIAETDKDTDTDIRDAIDESWLPWRSDIANRLQRQHVSTEEAFILKKDSDSFLGRRKRYRRGRPDPDRGALPLRDLNSAKFKNFRYFFPEKTEWFPSYARIWEMCVYKNWKKFEGLLANKRGPYCDWEEIYEIHKDWKEEGFTYEFASAFMAFVLCSRSPNKQEQKDNCPAPCTSNPCKGPHMARCRETGAKVSKSWTCECHPGWKYNTRTKKCDDLNVCKTSREQCIKANTQECVEKAGYAHECICKRQWMGQKCEKPFDACVDYDNPCGQYGRCEAHPGQRSWTCHCMDGWGDDPEQEGRDCHRKDRVCDNIVCVNGGECQESESGQVGKCICTEEWTGDTCADPMPSWTMWQPWGPCSVSCGYDGVRVRERECDHKDAVYCGPGTDEEHVECNGPICQVDGEWGEWIKVTDCSYNCGGGHYIQARNCVYDTDDPEGYGEVCSGRAIVYADCNIMSCPRSEKRWLRVDINSLARTIVSQTDSAVGDWGAWNSWADCSKTCDVGFRSRNRICLSSIGACQGSSEEVEDCTVKFCDKEAGLLPWGSWSYWTRCEEDKHFCYRYRECPYSIADEEFSEACPGKSSQSVPCEEMKCGEPQEDESRVVAPPKVVAVVQPQEEREPEVEMAEEEKTLDESPNQYRPQSGDRGRFMAQQYPAYDQGLPPPSNRRARAREDGETSAFGIGAVAALAAIAFMGHMLYKKYKKRKQRKKQKKKGAV